MFPIPSLSTKVSEELAASIFRVEELSPALILVSCLASSSTLKMVGDMFLRNVDWLSHGILYQRIDLFVINKVVRINPSLATIV
jgi:hypothetical protein